ncbi:MAG: hypothetical protein AAFZ63_25840, partial [Bacteroidota bacterium]
TNKYGFQHNANGSNPAEIEITESTTVNIDLADDGIRIEGTGNNTILNQGTLTIEDSNSDGIDIVTGSFTNEGSLTITDANTNGIYVKAGGTFNNNGGDITVDNPGLTTTNGVRNDGTFGNNSGSLMIDNANNDGIEANASTTNDATITITSTGNNTNNGIYIGSTFMNTGMISISGVDNYGIQVDGGSLTNNSVGTIESNATGSGSARHGLYVADGTCTNNGDFTATVTDASARAVRTSLTGTLSNNAVFTATGGNTGQRVRIEGTLENTVGAKLAIGDGRINMQDGAAAFVNNGLMVSSYTSAHILVGGAGAPLETATNNAIFIANTSNFASGNAGTFSDSGHEASALISIDAGGACSATIANASYSWDAPGEAFSGVSSGSGVLNFPAMSVENTTLALQTSIQGELIEVEVTNICAAAIILPVDWLDISAEAQSKSIMLKWQTATETNNDFMAIEHSTDGVNFKEIGRVNGAGNSTSTQSYAWEDRTPIIGTNYYRVRQVDFDGTTDYSPLVSAVFQKTTSGEVVIYPTVVTSGQVPSIRFSSPVDARTTISIFDNSGRLYHEQIFETREDALNIGHLPPGNYWCQILLEDEYFTQRLIITD